MGVRSIMPNSLTFTVEVQLSTVKRLRVPVTVDLQERYLSFCASVVYEVLAELDDFLDQLSDITANQLALLKWDGTDDMTTEYQEVRILAAVQVVRSTARFNIVLEGPQRLNVEELTDNTLIWVLQG